MVIRARGQAAYDRARRSLVWQARLPDRYPCEIVEPSQAGDVGAIIRRAAGAGNKVSVVSSGHSYCATGLQQDAVLCDLRGFQQLEVDSGRFLAHVGVGVTNGTLDAVLEQHGLAFPIGHSPSVAVGGYLLGGGLGWNSEAWGQAACFSVEGADVVLANGASLRVTKHDEPELFWALRGAGPLFPGVVTSYSLALQPRPSVIIEASRSFALDATDALSEWIVQSLEHKDADIELSVSFETLQSSSTPETKAVTLNAVIFGSSATDTEERLDQLTRSWPCEGALSPLSRAVTKFSALLAQNDPRPHRHAVETAWTDQIDHVLGILARCFVGCPSPHSSMHVSFRTDPDVVSDGAYSLTAKALVFCASVWTDETDDERQVAWSAAVSDALAPITVGRYINETDYVSRPQRIEESFAPSAFARILSVRARYDPDQVFDLPH